MKNLVNLGIGHRNIRSRVKTLLSAGAASALLLTGLAFVAAPPASATTATTFSFSSITSATAGSANPLSFTVTASAVPATADSISISSTDCTLGGAGPSNAATTNGSGVATFNTVYVETGTSCILTATVETGTDSGDTGQSSAFDVAPGLASQLVFTTAPPATATSGVSFPVVVQIEDQGSNVETGSSDGVTISSTTPTVCIVSGSDGGPASHGIATFSIVLTVTSGQNCTLIATDSASSLTKNSSVVAVATDTPSKLGFSTEPPTTVIAGATMASFAVSVEESNGVTFTSGVGATDSITLTSSCTLSGTTTVPALAGVATFTTVSIKTGASCTLIATDATRTLATATSNAITVFPGAAAKVAFTTPPPTTFTTAGTVITAFKVSVEDANGNVLTSGTGASDNIVITSPCTLGGTTSEAAIAGVATFSALEINVTGACALTATDSSRPLTTAAATTTVGTPQPALTVTSLKGLVGTALKIKTSGGAGTGALTLTTTTGTAGCTVVGSTIKAKKAGTCSVTATKAGTTTYIAVSSVATKITFALPFKVTRIAGTIYAGRTQTVTLIGSGFMGQPRIITNAGGVRARVAGDTGKTLRVVITASSAAKTGTHTMTVILSNGKRTSVKFSLR